MEVLDGGAFFFVFLGSADECQRTVASGLTWQPHLGQAMEEAKKMKIVRQWKTLTRQEAVAKKKMAAVWTK